MSRKTIKEDLDDREQELESPSIKISASPGNKLSQTLHEKNPSSSLFVSKMKNGFALGEVICDESGKPSDCRILQVNSALEKMAAIRAENVIGKKISEVFPGTEGFWVKKCGQIALKGNAKCFKTESALFDRYFELVAYSPEKSQGRKGCHAKND